MKFKFEHLIIWQKGMELGEDIFQLTRNFLKEEMYNLTSQLPLKEILIMFVNQQLPTPDFGLQAFSPHQLNK